MSKFVIVQSLIDSFSEPNLLTYRFLCTLYRQGINCFFVLWRSVRRPLLCVFSYWLLIYRLAQSLNLFFKKNLQLTWVQQLKVIEMPSMTSLLYGKCINSKWSFKEASYCFVQMTTVLLIYISLFENNIYIHTMIMWKVWNKTCCPKKALPTIPLGWIFLITQTKLLYKEMKQE